MDTLTIYENVHLVLPPEKDAVHYGNHSCDPTMWHVGPFEIATRRAVHVGEELTIDYGTQTGAPRLHDGLQLWLPPVSWQSLE